MLAEFKDIRGSDLISKIDPLALYNVQEVQELLAEETLREIFKDYCESFEALKLTDIPVYLKTYEEWLDLGVSCGEFILKDGKYYLAI